MYIKQVLPDGKQLETLFRFVENTIKELPQYVYMMRPDLNKKRVDNSITFPQAMRLFLERADRLSLIHI